jgi:hypothetical protein
VFAGARLGWGTYQSVRVFYDVFRAIRSPGTQVILGEPPFTRDPLTAPIADSQAEVMRFAGDAVVPLWLAAVYIGSNITLNSLNWYWFGKMIQTIRKRFEPGAKDVAAKKEAQFTNGAVKGEATAMKVEGDLRKRKA